MEVTMRSFFVLLLVLCLSAPAYAAGGFEGPGSAVQGQGGFQGPTTGVGATTVQQALKARDDTAVVLTGTITSRVAGSDDKYMFRDSTGEILVDIDHKVFAGRTVTPQNTVRISGEVDKEMLEATKIDVKMLEIVR